MDSSAADDFEDLLAMTQDDAPDLDMFEGIVDEAPAPAPVKKAPAKKAPAKKAAPAVDPMDEEIARLKAQLAEPVPSFSDEPEDDEPEDPEVLAKKQQIKDLQDQVARRQAAVVENAPAKLVRASSADKLLIHIESDGFLAFGQIWYRGQEIEIDLNGPVYAKTKDRNGDSWVDLVDDREGQLAKWGEVKFASGPFVPRRGEKFDDALVAEDARRRRAVPIIIS